MSDVSRRSVAIAATYALLGHGRPADAAPSPSFDTLFTRLKQAPETISTVLGYREFRDKPFGVEGEERAPLTAVPSTTKISDKATELIIFFEVSGRAAYQQKYRRPIWPEGESGVTIGIGYDVGYSSPSLLAQDWAGYPNVISADLARVCGLTGTRAAAQLASVQNVVIEFEQAREQFVKNEQPKYVGITERALPNFQKLSEPSRGALVSLVYNRGASFRAPLTTAQPDNYVEMRAILRYMQAEHFSAIPDEITKMSRIWANQPKLRNGLRKRRELEAALFKSGQV